MHKRAWFFLLLIILGAIIVRSYRFDFPIADWHSWRQADTSMVSRNFVKNGFDILHPRFDDLSSGVSLIDNPEGYRFVEFPIYNVLQAGFFVLFGTFTLEQWGRLVTIGSSVATIIFVYLFIRKYISARAALFAAFFYAFVPYNIYYGRSVLPDVSMVATLMGGLYFLDRWLEKNSWISFTLAVVFSALSLLLKPYALFFTLPFIYIILRKHGVSSFLNMKVWMFIILSFLPLMLWRGWIAQYPEGVPRTDWLFNGNGIRFKGSFFHWIFAERIGKFILGYFGLPFIIIGMVTRAKKEGLILFLFLISSLVYITTLATGNVQHDYYQILIIPTLAMFFGKGVDAILDRENGIFNRFAAYPVLIVSMLFMFGFGWYYIRDFFNMQHYEIVTAGQAVDRLVPKDAKVIAPLGGDTSFLYYTNRKGWPVWDRELPDFIEAGATHMVFAKPTEPELNFEHYFATVDKQPDYVIYDLRKPLRPLDEEIEPAPAPASESAVRTLE